MGGEARRGWFLSRQKWKPDPIKFPSSKQPHRRLSFTFHTGQTTIRVERKVAEAHVPLRLPMRTGLTLQGRGRGSRLLRMDQGRLCALHLKSMKRRVL